MRIICLCVILLVLTAVLPHQVFAQDTVVLKNANEIMGLVQNGREVRLIFGSVHYYVPEKNLNIYCDTTYVYRQEKLYVLYGNVKVEDDEKRFFSELIQYYAAKEEIHSPNRFTYEDKTSDITITADSGIYYYDNEVLVAEGNVVYRDSLKSIIADRIEYTENGSEIYAKGNVRIEDYEQMVVATAQTAFFKEEEQYGFLTGNPRIAAADSTETDSMYITGKKMEYFGGDSSRFVVTDSVNAWRGKLKAVSQRATYDASASIVYLRDNPAIMHGSTKIFGSEIDLILDDRVLTKVVVRDNAKALTDADSTGAYDLQNILRGKTITIYLEEETIYKIVATQNAESEYYVFDNDELSGKNISLSGEIVIYFKDGTVNEISYLNSVLSNFIPKNMLPDIKKKKNE